MTEYTIEPESATHSNLIAIEGKKRTKVATDTHEAIEVMRTTLAESSTPKKHDADAPMDILVPDL